MRIGTIIILYTIARVQKTTRLCVLVYNIIRTGDADIVCTRGKQKSGRGWRRTQNLGPNLNKWRRRWRWARPSSRQKQK